MAMSEGRRHILTGVAGSRTASRTLACLAWLFFFVVLPCLPCRAGPQLESYLAGIDGCRERGALGECIQDLRSLAQERPGAPEPLLGLAYAQQLAGKNAEAIALVERALGLETLPVGALNAAGAILLQAGEAERAREVLDRARSGASGEEVEVGLQSGLAYNLGLAHQHLGDLAEAEAAFAEAARLARSSGDTDREAMALAGSAQVLLLR